MEQDETTPEALAEEYTAEELYEQAQDLDVEGRSSMDKEELAEAVASSKPQSSSGVEGGTEGEGGDVAEGNSVADQPGAAIDTGQPLHTSPSVNQPQGEPRES